MKFELTVILNAFSNQSIFIPDISYTELVIQSKWTLSMPNQHFEEIPSKKFTLNYWYSTKESSFIKKFNVFVQIYSLKERSQAKSCLKRCSKVNFVQ
jgi:hypothetical protein